MEIKFEELKGLIIDRIEADKDKVRFHSGDIVYQLHHRQD